MKYYLKSKWKMVTLVCFLQILMGAFYMALQLMLMEAMGAAIALEFQRFFIWFVVLVVAWGLYFVLGTLRSVSQAQTIRQLNNQVRHDLHLSLLKKDHQEYHAHNTGEYISWFTNDVKQIESLAWGPFFGLVGSSATVVFCMVALVSIHWSLLLYSLISAVIMWYMPKLFEKRMENLGKTCSAQQAAAVAQMKDLLGGFDVLRFFGLGNRFLRQGDNVSDQIEKPGYRLNCTQSAISNGMGFLSVALQLLSQVLVMVLVFLKLVALAVLMGSSNLIAGVTNGLNSIAASRISLIASKPFFGKITTHDESSFEKAGPDITSVQKVLAVENISFAYNEKPILQELSLRFETGKKYAITGPSGCGKSTLLKLLLGWLPDYEGTIRFDGTDAKTFTTEQLQQQMSYIEQDVFLFNTTIRENITLGEKFTEEQMAKALKGSALDGDLAGMPLGLDTPVGEEGSCLSGGQKQRVAIARALIHNRSILLVDEGTSALDPKNADIVEKSLLENPDLTLILVSHHLSPERKAQFDQVYELEPVKA